MTPIDMMTSAFLQLPFRYQLAILDYIKTFYLMPQMSTHYLSLTDEVMWDTILQGVKANNGYSMLWDMISMHRTMPITENPFLSTKDIDKNPI